MNKIFLIITLIIIGVILMGGFLVRQNQLPKIFFCDSDTECVLTNTSSSICAGCDLSSEVWKCVSVEESKKIKDERRKNFEKNDLLCYPCTAPRQEYICICEDGICKKIEKQVEETEKQEETKLILEEQFCSGETLEECDGKRVCLIGVVNVEPAGKNYGYEMSEVEWDSNIIKNVIINSSQYNLKIPLAKKIEIKGIVHAYREVKDDGLQHFVGFEDRLYDPTVIAVDEIRELQE